MDENVIVDFKQFVATTISQSTSQIRSDIADLKGDVAIAKADLAGLRRDVTRLDKKVDNPSACVTEAIANGNEETEARLKNHDRRIIRLESKIT